MRRSPMIGLAAAGVIALAGGVQAANLIDAQRDRPGTVLSYHVIDDLHLQVLGEYGGCEKFHRIDATDRVNGVALTVVLRKEARVLFFEKHCNAQARSILQVVTLRTPLAGRAVVQGACPEKQLSPPVCTAGAPVRTQ